MLRPVRTLLTMLSIAVAVGSLIAVLQATSATRKQLDVLHQTVSTNVSAEIVSADGKEFPSELLPGVMSLPQVRSAIPVVHLFGTVTFGETLVRSVLTGVDLEQYGDFRAFKLTSGRLFSSPGEVCVEAGVASRLGLVVGDKLTIRSRDVPIASRKTVTGILEFTGVAALDERGSVFLPVREAARLKRATGKITSILVTYADNTDSRQMSAKIEQLLPEGLAVSRGASSSELSRPTESLVNVSLIVAATLSMVAAVFIVVNTFQISVRERQRQFALFRIAGATVEQIRHCMYREAILFAVAGTFCGVGIGIFSGRILTAGMYDLFHVEVPVIPFHFTSVLAGLIFGPIATMASVWVPARVASRVAPLTAARSAVPSEGIFRLRPLLVAGVVTILISGLLFVINELEQTSVWTAVIAMTSLQIGLILILPVVIRPGTFLIYSLTEHVMPVESQLGRRQILDNFGRSSLTIVVLFIVTVSSVSIGNTILSVTGDIESWLDQTVTADFLLRASRPRIDMSQSDEMPENFDAQLESIPGIKMTDRVTFSLITINGQTATLAVRELEKYPGLPLVIQEGEMTEVRRGLLQGEIVIGSVLSGKLKIRPGDTVRVDAEGINQVVRVAGIVQEYTAGGLMAIMNREAAQKTFPLTQTHVYMIQCQDGKTTEAGEALRDLARREGLIFQSLADVRHLVRQMVSGVTNRLWLILVISLFIAAFAVINTLTMNVLEQTRYLGVLRTIGMTRFQVFRMFVLQAFVLGLLALLPGTMVGAMMSALISVTFRSVAEHGIAFRLDTLLTVGYFGLGLLLSMLAAMLPAIRAGRLPPLEAIRQE